MVLIKIYLKDDLKERYEIFSEGGDFWASFKAVMHDTKSEFWDNKETEKVETAPQVITEAFKKTCLKRS